MQLRKAKEFYKKGIITGFTAKKENGGWLLLINGTEERVWPLQTVRDDDKVFSTLDSLEKEIERIAGEVSSLIINLK